MLRDGGLIGSAKAFSVNVLPKDSSAGNRCLIWPIVFCALVIYVTTACTRISLTKQPTDSQKKWNIQQSANTTKVESGDQPLSGRWRTGFQVGDRAFQATMTLTQHGSRFQGEGTDDQGGKHFKVAQGQIAGNQIQFYKCYADGSEIEHSGTVKMVNADDYKGPYMSGQYIVPSNGALVTSNWEAEKITSESSGQAAAPFSPSALSNTIQSAVQTLWPTDKAPDLSGKWEVAYEYNFKTIHSVIYMETDNGKVRGHGHDINTQEKFTIEKGWYHFPKLTIIRKYVKGKEAAQTRTMMFKGTVSIVNERDYSGPWIKGKTQGGGNWEAQLIK